MKEISTISGSMNIKIKVLTVLFICFSIVSCKKSDSGSDLSNEISVGNMVPFNTGDTIVAGFNSVSSNKLNKGVPALLNKAAGTDIEIAGKIDYRPELVQAFNTLYGSDFSQLPEDFFKLSGDGKVRVKAGQLQSIDSLKIEVGRVPSGLTLGTHRYLIPVTFLEQNNASLKSQTMYILSNIFVTSRSLSISVANNVTKNWLFYANADPSKEIAVAFDQTIKSSFELKLSDLNNIKLVDSFNIANKTRYYPLPQGSYTLQNNAVIPANKIYSDPNARLSITNPTLLDEKNMYLLAIEIPDKKIANVNSSIVYIKVLKYNLFVSATELQGGKIDRKNWSLKASSTYAPQKVQSMLDGDNDTFWESASRTAGIPHSIEIDMNDTQTVRGFSIVPGYKFIREDFTEMEVFSSNDGLSWNFEGIYVGTPTDPKTSSKDPDIKNIKFRSSVTARYFKFNITNATNTYSTISEVYGIK